MCGAGYGLEIKLIDFNILEIYMADSLSANLFFKSISYIAFSRIAPALALAKTCEKVATRLSGPDGFGNCKGCQFTPDTLAIDKVNHELL